LANISLRQITQLRLFYAAHPTGVDCWKHTSGSTCDS
jgi:hypothetical protein